MAGEAADRRTGAALTLAALAILALAGPAGAAARAGPAAARAGPAECRAGTARVEVLDGVGQRGEIRLASGARATLDSLRWPEAEEASAEARAWLDARRGLRLTLVPRGQPDRWGRERVDALAEEADADLAGGLIGAGLAFADAGEAESLCRPALRAVEAAARERRLGLWRQPPAAADDGPGLRALAGRFAVVEGLVRHVGERPARTYLDFVARGADGLTVTVTKRTWRMMAARGLSADSIEGRRVRVRGILEIRGGPTLDVAADAVEILGGADLPGAGPGAGEGLRR